MKRLHFVLFFDLDIWIILRKDVFSCEYNILLYNDRACIYFNVYTILYIELQYVKSDLRGHAMYEYHV